MLVLAAVGAVVALGFVIVEISDPPAGALPTQIARVLPADFPHSLLSSGAIGNGEAVAVTALAIAALGLIAAITALRADRGLI